jgi:hypothetical protein
VNKSIDYVGIDYLPEDLRPAIKLNVPDWRRGRWAYPRPEDLTPRRWAWEFLRRSPEYQVRWAEDVGPRFAADGSLTPPPAIDLTEWARAFGLSYPLDPAESVDDPPFIISTSPLTSRESIRYGPAKLTLLDNEAAIVVDLSRPIGEQIDGAVRELRTKKKKPKGYPRFRPEIYPTYLLVLDARAAGAGYTEIAKVLYPNEDSEVARDHVKRHLAAAGRLCWRDYIFIAIASAQAGSTKARH